MLHVKVFSPVVLWDLFSLISSKYFQAAFVCRSPWCWKIQRASGSQQQISFCFLENVKVRHNTQSFLWQQRHEMFNYDNHLWWYSLRTCQICTQRSRLVDVTRPQPQAPTVVRKIRFTAPMPTQLGWFFLEGQQKALSSHVGL